MDKLNYQIWLKATPLEDSEGKEGKSDVLFSSNSVKKVLFRIFDILKSEVDIPLRREEMSTGEIIFKRFASDDLSTDEKIEKRLNKHIKNLNRHDSLLEEVSNLIVSLRKKRIKSWEEILNMYIENKKKYNEEIKNLWINRRNSL